MSRFAPPPASDGSKQRGDAGNSIATGDVDLTTDSAGSENVGRELLQRRDRGPGSRSSSLAKRKAKLASLASRIVPPSFDRPVLEQAQEESGHLRELLDALPAAVYTTDAAGRITFFNQAAVEFSGRRPELGSDHWCVSWRLFRPDGTPLPHDECPMAIALKEDRPIRGIEAIAERPDGTRVRFMPYPTPLHDSSGRLVGAINLLMDMTERHDADLESARLAAIVVSSDDAIISKTIEGRITSWNAGATRIFGYEASEMIGEPILRLIPPELHHEEKEILARLQRGERIEHYETVRVAKDGRRVDVSLTVSPLRDRSGKVVGASKVGRDITERKRTEKLQRVLTDEL